MSRRDELQRTIRKIPTGRLKRGWEMAKMVNEGVGLGRMKRQAKEMVKGGAASIQEELNRELGQNLAKSMGEMKGLVMKAGQMLSYLDNQMPAPLREALSELQTRVKPVDTEAMRAIFHRSFGAYPEEAFEKFDPVPLAAASVGQVYRATLKDGREVAVKIQYPEIVNAVKNDLQNMSLMTHLGKVLNAGVDDVIQELRAALRDELNYEQEAKNLLTFRAIYAGDPLIRIPELVPEWCSKTVLTTSFEEGVSFKEMQKTFTPAQKFHISKAMGRFFYVAFYFYGLFNADPHPGNYLFRPDGQTVFLDFGCVRRFDRQFLDLQIGFTKVLREGNRRAIEEHLIKMGIVPREVRHKMDWELLLAFFGLTYQPIVKDEDFQYTPDYNRRVSEAMIRLSKKHLRLARMPKQFVFLNRITFGLNAIYAELGLRLNYYQPASVMMSFYDTHLKGQAISDPLKDRIDYMALGIHHPEPPAHILGAS